MITPVSVRPRVGGIATVQSLLKTARVRPRAPDKCSSVCLMDYTVKKLVGFPVCGQLQCSLVGPAFRLN